MPFQIPEFIYLSLSKVKSIMGNSNSSSGGGISRRRQGNWRSQPPPPPPPQPPHPQIRPNSYIFAAPNPYHPSPQPGYYPLHPPAAMPMPMPMAPYHHHHGPPNWAAPASYPYGPIMPSPVPVPVPGPGPYVEHQKAVTIRNDVNVNKETLRLEPDQNNPGMFLLSFTFDATVPASITVMYFAKEGEDCKLTQTRESLIPPVTVHFERGLGQKFRQASGTGINFSLFEECDLVKKGDGDVCPLAVKAEACLVNQTETTSDENPVPAGSTESQITQALFEKDGEEYKVKVLKQILWVNQTRYELQEIYGIGNTVAGENDGSDSLKECVICLSEPRDTTVLPCRHMCLCRECAKVLRFQANRCPICRQPIERLLEIKVSNGSDQETSSS